MDMRAAAGSPRSQNDEVEDHVPGEENVDSTSQLADDLFKNGESDDDSLLPPPETSEGSKVGRNVLGCSSRWVAAHQVTLIPVRIRRG